MNKRFLSTLLTGAIFLAATSMFVSCKDYDDDIKNLQAQIDKAALKADLEALQTKLSQVEATANAAATKAELEAAKTTLSGDIKKAQDAADAAGRQAAQAISDAAKAQKAADAAQAFAETVKTTADAAKALAEAAATKDDLATAKKELTGLISKAQETADAAKKLAEAAATKTELKEAVDKLTEAAANAQKTADEALTIAKAAATKAEFDEAVAKLTEAAANAQKTADEAKKLAEAAATKDELADAKKELRDFATDAATQAYTNALSQAKSYAEGLVKDQKDAQALVDAAQNEALETLAKELRGKIKDIEDDIDALEAADKATAERIDQIVKNYDAQIANLFSAVTSVSLYVSGLASTSPYQDFYGGHVPALLLFPYATEFDNVFPANDKITDKQYTFKKGTNSTLERSLMVRVSPTNAVLSADMITLINSKGEAIPSSLIETVEVEPYEELLTATRGGAVSNSGLWTVTFKLKDGFAEEDLAAVAEKDSKNVVFAVAVNNTPEDADARLVVSEYDVLVDAGIATPAYAFDVNDTPVADIHNRWEHCDEGTSTLGVPELNWKYNSAQNPVPAVKATEDNSGDRVDGIYGYDYRQDEPILGVVAGEEITIEFPELDEFKALRGFYVTLDQDFALESNPSEINAWTSYEYENVGYTKTDGTIVAAKMQDGNKGSITIKDLHNVKGDIIGFRVYAVNLDGTLYDPDGRAFYVKVGNAIEDKTIDGITVVISTQGDSENAFGTGEEIFEIPEGTFSKEVTGYGILWGDKNPFVRIYGDNYVDNDYAADSAPWQSNIQGEINGEFATPVKETPSEYEDEDGYKRSLEDYYDLMDDESMIQLLFSADKENWYPINYFAYEEELDKIKYGKAIMTHANRLLDNGTYHIVLSGTSEKMEASEYTAIGQYFTDNYISWSQSAIERVHFYITKALPEFPAGLSKKKDQLPDDLLTVWMKPCDADNYAASTWVVDDKEDYMTTTYLYKGYGESGSQFYGQDIHPYDLADIFNMVQNSSVTLDGEVVPTFLWKFNDSDKSNGKNVPTYSAIGSIFSFDIYGYSYANYSRDTRANSYFVPYAEESFINDGEKKNVDADYYYYNISLSQQRVAGTQYYKPLVRDWKTEKKNVFKVEYKCVMDGNFAMDKKWKGEFAYEDETYTIDLDSVLYTAVSLPSYILPEKTGIEEKTLGELIENGKLVLTGATIDNTDYFEVNPDLTAITLQSTRSTVRPSLDKDQKFTVTAIVEDIFGHKFTIAIPVVMKKPVQSAPRL